MLRRTSTLSTVQFGSPLASCTSDPTHMPSHSTTSFNGEITNSEEERMVAATLETQPLLFYTNVVYPYCGARAAQHAKATVAPAARKRTYAEAFVHADMQSESRSPTAHGSASPWWQAPWSAARAGLSRLWHIASPHPSHIMPSLDPLLHDFVQHIIHDTSVRAFLESTTLADLWSLAAVSIYFERVCAAHGSYSMALNEARETDGCLAEALRAPNMFFHMLWLHYAMEEDFEDFAQEIVRVHVGRLRHPLHASGAQLDEHMRKRRRFVARMDAFHAGTWALLIQLGLNAHVALDVLQVRVAALRALGGFGMMTQRPEVLVHDETVTVRAPVLAIKPK